MCLENINMELGYFFSKKLSHLQFKVAIFIWHGFFDGKETILNLKTVSSYLNTTKPALIRCLKFFNSNGYFMVKFLNNDTQCQIFKR